MLVSRRQWLRGAAAGLGVSVLSRWSMGCGDNSGTNAVVVVAFEVDSTRAILVVHSDAVATVALVVTDEYGNSAQAMDIEIDADSNSGRLEITGLSPATTYHVWTEAAVAAQGDAKTPQLRFATAPTDDDTRAVRIAWSADIDVNAMFDSNINLAIANSTPDLYVSIGDWPYSDDAPGAITLEDYRERFRESRHDARVMPWMTTTSIRAMYDDHEVANNWDATFRQDQSERTAAALQVWDECFAWRIYDGAGGDTADAAPDTRYRRWRWGAHVECFLLDTRRFRSADADPDSPHKTMLGATQKAWLLDRVARSTATYKFIFTTIPLDFSFGNDGWSSFATEREEIFAAIAAAKVDGIMFFTADQHWFAVHRHPCGAREFQVGPVHRGMPVLPAPQHGVLLRISTYNFGLLDIDGEGNLTVTGVGPEGEILYQESFVATDLVLSSTPAT